MYLLEKLVMALVALAMAVSRSSGETSGLVASMDVAVTVRVCSGGQGSVEGTKAFVTEYPAARRSKDILIMVINGMLVLKLFEKDKINQFVD